MKKKIFILSLSVCILLLICSSVVFSASVYDVKLNNDVNAITVQHLNLFDENKKRIIATSDECPYVTPDGSLIKCNGINAEIINAVCVNVTVDGTCNTYNVPIDNIKNTLDYLNIDLGKDDIINYDLSSTVFQNQKIIIKRVTFGESFETRKLKYKTVNIKSDNMLLGEKKIVQKGTDGTEKLKFKDTYIDGELVYHTEIDSVIIKSPQNKIVKNGTKKIIVLENKYSSDNKKVLVKTQFDNKDFKLPKVKLSESDRDLLERLLTGEFGSSYVGACLVAQSIKCAIVNDGYSSIKQLIIGMGYVGRTDIGKSQNAINAVKFIFDENGLAVKHRLFYMCTEDYYNNNPNNFHSTQNEILQFENVKFFDRWN